MKNEKQSKSFLKNLLGEATPAKASGAVFTLATIMPVFISVLFLIVLGILGQMYEGVEEKDWYLYASFLLPQIAFILVALWYFKWTQHSFIDIFKVKKCSFKYFIWAIILQMGLLSLSELNTLFLKWLGNIGYQDSGINLPSMNGFGFVGLLVVVAFLPAILEELIFRGLLLRGLHCFGTTWAVIICGALFALYHQNPAQTLYQFCCGMAFALIAIRAGSILPTILSHFLNNALILILVKLGVSTFSPFLQWMMIVVCSFCLIVSLIYLIFIDRMGACTQRNKINNNSEHKKFWIYAAMGIIICLISWFTMLVTGIIGA